MSYYNFLDPLYPDPYRDGAVSALANAGRPRPGPTNAQVAGAVSALANAGRADHTEPEPVEPLSDDDLDDARRIASISALAGAGRALAPMAPGGPDDIEKALLNEQAAARGLADTGRRLAPKPVEEPPPEPEAPNPFQPKSSVVVEETPRGAAVTKTTIQHDPEPGVSGWALAADILLNKARGIGSIIAQAEQQKAEYRRQKGANAQRDQELELARGNLDARNREIEMQARALGLREGKTGAYGSGGGSKEPLSNDKAKALIGAPPEPEAEKPGDFDADTVVVAGLPDQPSPDEVERTEDFVTPSASGAPSPSAAGSMAERRQKLAEDKFEFQKKQAEAKAASAASGGGETPAQRAKQAQQNLLSSPVPGVAVFDDDDSQTAWKAATTTASARDKILKYATGARGALEALDDMIKLREKYGVEVVGSQKAAYDAAQTRAISGYTQIGHSGVLNASEFERYKDIIPGMGPRVMDAVDAASSSLIGGKKDTTLAELKAVRDETRAAFDSGLSTVGARYDDAFRSGPRAPTNAQTSQVPDGETKPLSQAANSGSAAPTNTSNAVDESFVPKGVGAGKQSAIAPGGTYQVRDPKTGKTGRVKGDISKFMSEHPGWEVVGG